MNDKTVHISIGIATFFLIGGIILGGILGSAMGWSFFRPPPRLAVIDMQALISKGSQHLVKTSSNKALGKAAKVSSHQIQEMSEQLKETLEDFAAQHHLILLAKGAVMGGNLPDYTEEIAGDAFPDEATRLLAFGENKNASPQSKNLESKGFRLESQRPQGQGTMGKRREGQEKQP